VKFCRPDDAERQNQSLKFDNFNLYGISITRLLTITTNYMEQERLWAGIEKLVGRDYELDGLGIEFWRERDFPRSFKQAMGCT
jgi:hypothetical protein